MGELLRKPQNTNVSSGVTLIHDIQAGNAPLEYVSFKVVELKAGSLFSEILLGKECCVVVLAGQIHFSDQSQTYTNLGTRKRVFEQIPTDSVYVSNGQSFKIEAATDSKVALCYSPTNQTLPTQLIRAKDNGIELRGKNNNQRLVHNILPDSNPVAHRLLVVEVFTKSGNWSSYPPHKHDQDNLPTESFLEETYYHEINPQQGFVFQRVYTDDRTIDDTMTVEHGDVVLVPKGYHPVGVPDGYTSYYLNVMAGPKRLWKFYNDPAHEWILDRQ